MKQIKDDQLISLIISKLDNIENKVDKIDERLDSSEKVQIRQELNLKEHMHRCDLLEEQQNSIKDALEPLIKVHTIGWGICKIIAGVSVLVGIIKTLQIFGK